MVLSCFKVLCRNVTAHRLEAIETEAALRSACATSKELNVKLGCPHGELLRLNLEVPGCKRCSAGAGLSAFGGCVHETHGRAKTRADGFYADGRVMTMAG